jgi:prephenate dehydrogenase
MKLKTSHNILIVGLGLLGGSYALALKQKGFKVSAIDVSDKTVEYAIKNKIVDLAVTTPNKELIESTDLIIFALYPHIFCDWVKEYGKYFKSGTIITDVTGVKGAIIENINENLPKDVEFIAAHPMAGRETGGIENANTEMFKNANYIVVPTEKNTADAIELCKSLGETLGFANISELSVENHDRMIAFLSQLTHCIAVSLMCASDNPDLVKYTGDSFRDLTRIAEINDKMWSELFLCNKEALLQEMDSYKNAFDKLYEAIKNDDTNTMREMMKLSTARRRNFSQSI